MAAFRNGAMELINRKTKYVVAEKQITLFTLRSAEDGVSVWFTNSLAATV